METVAYLLIALVVISIVLQIILLVRKVPDNQQELALLSERLRKLEDLPAQLSALATSAGDLSRSSLNSVAELGFIKGSVAGITESQLKLIDAATRLEGELPTQFSDGTQSIVKALHESLAMHVAPELVEMKSGLKVAADDAVNADQSMRRIVEEKFGDIRNTLDTKLREINTQTAASAKALNDSAQLTTKIVSDHVVEMKATVDASLKTELGAIRTENIAKLEEMRKTVDEKLSETLEKRLGASFTLVSTRLEEVHRGLGEMQSLASGVGDLKKMLTNVKSRGTWGEIQLGALLEQFFSPHQYEKNVITVPNSNKRVEYAIKLPGRDADGSPVWLPIDAKFPMEDYQRLAEAQEQGNIAAIDESRRALELRIKAEAKAIRDSYIAPPSTTDFAILYLPTEGLYAEVLRIPGLADFVQRENKILLAGPTILHALLNSLQMGFRTLAIEKRSAEVWKVLGEVKTEFGKFGEAIAHAKKKLTEAQNSMESTEVRTRAVTRKLTAVDALPTPDTSNAVIATALAVASPLDLSESADAENSRALGSDA